VILNPVSDGKRKFGERILKKGPCTFFLRPGEIIENGIQQV